MIKLTYASTKCGPSHDLFAQPANLYNRFLFSALFSIHKTCGDQFPSNSTKELEAQGSCFKITGASLYSWPLVSIQ